MADDEQQESRDVLARNVSTKERSERCRELTSAAFAGMQKTRGRQQLARDFLRGRISANLPKAIRDASIRGGSDNSTLEYHAPQIMSRALQMVAEIAAQPPQPKRHPVARARESGAVSNRIERVATGVMGQLYGYRQSCDPVMLDSEAATTVIPSTAHWAEPVDQYDVLKPDEWKQLPDDLKALWDWQAEDGGGYRRYSRKYRRDGDGRPEWDDEYADGKPFREDTKKSAEAVEEEIEQRVRSKIPLEVRLLLPTQFAPVNSRWEGDRLTLDGIAVREKFSGTTLYRRGYRWSQDAGAWSANPAYNDLAPVTLDTLLLQDKDGCPYLIYSIDGCVTYRQDGTHDFAEVVDLHERYGFDFLPVSYVTGLHTLVANPDDCIIPLLEPLIVPSLMRDRLVAMNDFHVQQVSCGGWFIKPDPKVVEVMGELAQKPNFEPKQMTAVTVPGDVMPAIHPGAGPGLMVQKDMLDLDLLAAQGPQAADAGSGIHQALISRDANRGMSMTWDGIDGLYAGTATNALRALACMSRTLGKPITLNILTEMPDNDTASSTKSTVVVDADMFGGDYRVVAWRPDEWGSNPTKQALLMQAQKDGQATWREMREAVGDPDPTGSFAEVFTDKMIMETDDGKQLVMTEQAKINNDLKALEQAKLRRDQLLNEQNVPTGMAGGIPGGVVDPSTANPSVMLDITAGGGGMPNPAANALNAAAGAPQAAVANIVASGGDASGLDFGASGPGGG
jgi:hypothetical protein